MNKPSFITVTGVDKFTSPSSLRILATNYNIFEFAWLLSSEKAGKANRYPSLSVVRRHVRALANQYRVPRVAFHLCGDWAQHLAAGGCVPDPLRDLFELAGSTRKFRIQLNLRSPTLVNHEEIQRSAAEGDLRRYNVGRVIVPVRNVFPPNAFGDASVNGAIAYLTDCSGGRGILPDRWPALPQGVAQDLSPPASPRFGFAGGLNPGNVAEQIARISSVAGSTPYWIDMETGVRTEDDKFNLEKAVQVWLQVRSIY